MIAEIEMHGRQDSWCELLQQQILDVNSKLEAAERDDFVAAGSGLQWCRRSRCATAS
jgi:hypothetical protein